MHADHQDRAGHLVLALAAGDRLVTDGTELTCAGTPEDLTIGQWPERAVKDASTDPGEQIIYAHVSDSSKIALSLLLRGRRGIIVEAVSGGKAARAAVSC
jgi:hypothetical protein